MTPDELRALQTPIKDRYRDDPDSAQATLSAVGELVLDQIACRITSSPAIDLCGLHPAAGGDGSFACAAEMMLASIVGCAGTTLAAVATATGIPVTGGTITCEGDMDFRGTLGIDRTSPIGFTALRLIFNLEGAAEKQQLDKLIQLTERYCVVLQTLRGNVPLETIIRH